MKKVLVLTMILLTINSTVAFGNSNVENTSLSCSILDSSNTQAISVDEYTFAVNGIIIRMNDEAKTVLQRLGKEKQYFESQSCAFQGLDKVYTYSSFEVTTYTMNNVDRIESIFFLDDTVKTSEGICLNQSLEDVKRVYGTNYEEVNGIYTYKKANCKLSFMIKNNKIVQIEYKAIVK